MIRAAGVRKTAMRIGVHHAMLLGWLSGDRDIRLGVLERLAVNFGLALRIDDAQEDRPPNPSDPE